VAGEFPPATKVDPTPTSYTEKSAKQSSGEHGNQPTVSSSKGPATRTPIASSAEEAVSLAHSRITNRGGVVGSDRR
jgi:hypothetical protein